MGTDLRGADLSGCSLRKARGRGADARGAILRGAILDSRSEFDSADFRGADLSRAWFGSAHLSGADLRGADLPESVFGRGNSLTGLRRARLAGCRLDGANGEVMGPVDIGADTPRLADGDDLHRWFADHGAPLVRVWQPEQH